MTNPYRDNIARIQTLVKKLSREHLYTTRPEQEYAGDSAYGLNFVVVSGGEPFDQALEEQLEDLMKEVTNDPNPETM